MCFPKWCHHTCSGRCRGLVDAAEPERAKALGSLWRVRRGASEPQYFHMMALTGHLAKLIFCSCGSSSFTPVPKVLPRACLRFRRQSVPGSLPHGPASDLALGNHSEERRNWKLMLAVDHHPDVHLLRSSLRSPHNRPYEKYVCHFLK